MTDTPPRDLADDPETAAALEAVLQSAEEGDGAVSWADVRGEVEGEQWGQLLENGALISAGDRFIIDDPVAVREALDERETTAGKRGW